MILPVGGPAGIWAYDCRECGARIASESHCIAVAGKPTLATYVNPAGLECEVMTVARAANLAQADDATEEHTWFEGYAWRPVGCAACGVHLGWRYEAAGAPSGPAGFFGLLVGALRKVREE